MQRCSSRADLRSVHDLIYLVSSRIEVPFAEPEFIGFTQAIRLTAITGMTPLKRSRHQYIKGRGGSHPPQMAACFS